MRVDPATPIYVLWHYPPFDAHSRPGPCVERLENAKLRPPVSTVTSIMTSHWSIAVQGDRPRGPLPVRSGGRELAFDLCESIVGTPLYRTISAHGCAAISNPASQDTTEAANLASRFYKAALEKERNG